MLPDRVSNPGPLTYQSGALPIALRGPAILCVKYDLIYFSFFSIFGYTIREKDKCLVSVTLNLANGNQLMCVTHLFTFWLPFSEI